MHIYIINTLFMRLKKNCARMTWLITALMHCRMGQQFLGYQAEPRKEAGSAHKVTNSFTPCDTQAPTADDIKEA